jgi:hypothetical protein
MGVPWPVRQREWVTRIRWARYRRELPEIEASRWEPIPRHQRPTRTPEEAAYQAALERWGDEGRDVYAQRLAVLARMNLDQPDKESMA